MRLVPERRAERARRGRLSRELLAMSGAPTTAPPPPPPSVPPVVHRRRDRGPIYIGLLAVAVAAIVVGVGAGTSWYGLKTASSTTSCPTGVTLQGAGASFPSSIVSQWTTNYHTATANTVNYDPNSAGEGITELTDKSVDFALTDEPLNSSQSSDLDKAVGTVLTLPVTGGAVVPIYYLPSYPYTLNLTGTELAGIYLGDITTWDNPTLVANNPGLAKVTTSITAVHRSDPAGMTYVLTTLMTEQNKSWRTNPSLGTSLSPDWPAFAGAEGADGGSAMLTDVKAVSGAIGYTDLYDAQAKGETIAYVDDALGVPVLATPADTAAAINEIYNATKSSLPTPTGDWAGVSWVNASGAGDYPLATLVYLLVPLNPGAGHTASSVDATALRQWIAWAATSGQTYSRTSFPFVSPPAGLLSEDLSAIAGMTYDGASFPSCS